MNKVIVTSSLGVQVYIEVEDPEPLRGVLRDLIPQLSEVPAAPQTGSQPGPASVVPRTPTEAVPAPVPTASTQQPPEPTEESGTSIGTTASETPIRDASASEQDFIAFCHRFNPLGDMRKAVVAAEAARLYLHICSVNQYQLSMLFRMAGWSIPAHFRSTLRNASRTRFRWLERVPDRDGYYRVSSNGRSFVLGENLPSLAQIRTQSGGHQI